MLDIEKYKGFSSNKYAINHRVDDSGDYTNHYYDIVAVYSYGQRTICGNIENPHDAELFASGPLFLEEIKQLRQEKELLEKQILDMKKILKIND